jgi:hypothetical protein
MPRDLFQQGPASSTQELVAGTSSTSSSTGPLPVPVPATSASTGVPVPRPRYLVGPPSGTSTTSSKVVLGLVPKYQSTTRVR